MEYQLLDSGYFEKLEKFGNVVLIRPVAHAIWVPKLSKNEWGKADARFSRERRSEWSVRGKLPDSWVVSFKGIKFLLKPTDFGHLGLFPEHGTFWPWMQEKIGSRKSSPKVLNLFAYSGGATFACAMAGAEVCHLDASKGMVAWAQENASLNELREAPIRWIVDDVKKYLKRAIRRGEKYDGIILDPPTFGRGKSGEVFKIEKDLIEIIQDCKQLLSSSPLFFLITCHTPGYTPLVLEHLLQDLLGGSIEAGEMVISGQMPLPSGSFAKWIS